MFTRPQTFTLFAESLMCQRCIPVDKTKGRAFVVNRNNSAMQRRVATLVKSVYPNHQSTTIGVPI
jgi:hypothetical protein